MRPLSVGETTRYESSVNPVRTDGRDIDPDVGSLVGEGSSQISSGSSDAHLESISEIWEKSRQQSGEVTYYDRPLLQKPVWEWVIPAYYYIGGLSGAALVLGAAAQLQGGEAGNRVAGRCQAIAFAGCGLSAFCLVYDLGRPERFLNMLRVFRPTSAMNVGAWILTAVGGSTTGAVLLRRQSGFLGDLGKICGYLAGFFGAGLATYTGVLVSNTAVPIWQQSRRMMPLLFGASAMASVGSAFNMFIESAEERSFSSTFGMLGQVAEIGAGLVMERQASEVERVGRPFRHGISGKMWKTAAWLTASSVLLNVLPGNSRAKRFTAGALGTLGSALMRFSIEQLGKASALDARASFQQQRAGKGAAELTAPS